MSRETIPLCLLLMVTVSGSEAQRSPLRLHERNCFYKYMRAEVVKKVLSNQKLRWSSPLNFNDPFDVSDKLRFPYSRQDLERATVEGLAALIEKGGVSERPQLAKLLGLVDRVASCETRSRLASLVRQFRDRDGASLAGWFDDMQRLWTQLRPQMRIICVSESNSITSMWNHYAAQYTGAVLEFSCIDKLDSPFLLARPVFYREELPVLPDVSHIVASLLGIKRLDVREFFADYEYVKTKDWSYEKEWRVVTYTREGEEGLYSDYQVHPLEVAAVYLGKDISAADRDAILALLDAKSEFSHVRAFQTKPSLTGNRFEFLEIA